MKTFFASLLGTLAAILLITFGGGLVLFFFILGAAALNEPESASVPSGSYLVFDLRANITDAPAQFDDSAFSAALGGFEAPAQLQHRLVTRALHEVANDDRIKGVVIKGSFTPGGYGTSYASLAEIRRALLVVKEAGKPIHAYLEYPDLRDYYIASVADDIALDPNGGVLMPGLASQPMFYAGLFEKYGIGVQTARVGKFKSAIEPYTRRDLSPENREQLQQILDDLWFDMRDTVARARDIEPVDLQSLLDSGEGYLADDVLAEGLVDRLVYIDEFLEDIKKATGRAGSSEAFKQVGLGQYIRQISQVSPGAEAEPATDGSENGRVAVVYAEGAIVNGEGQFSDVGGARFGRAIRQLRQDPDIKAIVLRVNSPGGSAVASDQILRELSLAAEQMPVVVSMGGYAASGGYWISAKGVRIFAESTTITGSIGVYGMLLNVEELANDFGLTFDTVKTGTFADSMTIARPKTAEEMALIQKSVSTIYDDFIELVSTGRDIEEDRVREIAEGRVWSGTSALELGLVDEIGGLSNAISYAAEEAGLERDFRLTEFPRKRDFAEVLSEALNRFQVKVSGNGIAAQIETRLETAQAELEAFNDPRGIYVRMPLELLIP